MIPEKFLTGFNNSLLNGEYNLLLGSGISLDSRNGEGEFLRSSEQLRKDLCMLIGVDENVSLPRAYSLLTDIQRKDELVDRFSKTHPGPSVSNVPHFLWRRLFTFNIDDVLENVYRANPGRKQILTPINFDEPFEPTPQREKLQVIHLHGWVSKPQSGFVFSVSEYIRVMTSLNPWMHLLSEILATEPFIISGTSLNETDLEFYLSHRTPGTPRRGSGPSLLIHPNPDIVIKSDCERFGLLLVTATFGDFMNWLRLQHPSPPTISELLVPDINQLFPPSLDPSILLRFFSDFELVPAGESLQPLTPSPFFYGREPSWMELDSHVDIERQDNELIRALVEEYNPPSVNTPRLFIISDEPGTGKTTVAKRVAHSLARSGKPVLSLRTLDRIDVESAITCLSEAKVTIYVLIDGLADHVDQVVDLLENPLVALHTVFIATERSYRQELIDVILADLPRVNRDLLNLTIEERLELIERYRRLGLIGNKDALSNPRQFAGRIINDSVAVAICRILNDFKPLNRIIDSLWSAASEDHRNIYISVALAQHCYRPGVRYSILQAIAGPTRPIDTLFTHVPLRLAYNVVNNEFVVALNSAIAEQELLRISHNKPLYLQKAFISLANALAPHVNRKAIMKRSPEARLVGRLLDYDKVVGPFLGSAAESFYISIQPRWEWNSRYWEQRALLTAQNDLTTALQYSRHAIAIENHSYPLTTLGKLLIKQMQMELSKRDSIFIEALNTLSSAIELEARRKRVTVHPYSSLFFGIQSFLDLGGQLSNDQEIKISGYLSEAARLFPYDPQIKDIIIRLKWIAPNLFNHLLY